MNIEDKNIDQLFSSSLSGEEHDLNQEQVWKNVEARLPKKKNRGGIWLFSIAGLLLALALIFFFNQEKNSSVAENKIGGGQNASQTSGLEIDRNKSEIDSVVNKELATDENIENSKTTIDNNNSVNNSNKTEDINNEIIKTDKTRSSKISTNTNFENNKIILQNNILKSLITNKKSIGKTAVDKNNKNTQSSKSNDLLSKSTQPIIEHNVELNNTNEVASELNIKNEETVSVAAVKKENIETNSETNLKNINNSFSFAQIIKSTELKQISFQNQEDELFYALGKRDDLRCVIKMPWRFFADVNGGGILPFVSNHSQTIEGENDFAFLNEWEAVQAPIAGYSFALSLGLMSNKGFEISTGLELEKYYQKAEVARSESRLITVWNEHAYFFRDSLNNINWLADSVVTTSTRDYKFKSKQTHTLINIPIQLAYTHEVNNFNIGLQLAAIINIDHSFSGKVLDPTVGFIDLTEDDEAQIYKSNVGIGWRVGLHLGVDIQDNWELYLQPQFTFNSKNRLKSNHPIYAKHRLAKVNIGLRYFF